MELAHASAEERSRIECHLVQKFYSHDSLNYLLEMLRSESNIIPLVPVF